MPSDTTASHPAVVEFRRCANEFQAGIIRAILEDAGIEAKIGTTERSLTGVFGLTGAFESVVLVRAEDYERAQETLEAKRAESIDLDWDRIDVGEPEDELARRIARGDRARQGWWRGGWKAAVVLIIPAIITMPFRPDVAWVFALAAIIAGAGSLGSWMISRARRLAGAGDPRPDPDAPSAKNLK